MNKISSVKKLIKSVFLTIFCAVTVVLFTLTAQAEGNVTLFDPVKGDVCFSSDEGIYPYVTNTYSNTTHNIGITGRTVSYSGTADISGKLRYKAAYLNSAGNIVSNTAKCYWKNNFVWEFDFKVTTLPSAGYDESFEIRLNTDSNAWRNSIRIVAYDEDTYYLRWGGANTDLAISSNTLSITKGSIYDLKKDETYHLKIEGDLKDTGNVYVTFTNPDVNGEEYIKTSVFPFVADTYSTLEEFKDGTKSATMQFVCHSAITFELLNEDFKIDRFRTVEPELTISEDKSQIEAKASIVNTTPAAFWTSPPVLFCAVYDTDGRMVKVAYNKTYIHTGVQSLAQYDYSVTLYGIDALTDDDYTVKTFLWNNMNDILPLVDEVEVSLDDLRNASQATPTPTVAPTAAPTAAPTPTATPGVSENEPDVLQVTSDGYLAKDDGEVVQLKGVNFGGWLIQETWMCPVFAFDDDITVKDGTENGWANLDTLDAMEELFGKEKTAELVNSYQDNYITEWDFQNVKNLGFNCIRIPFWYRNFMSDENGTYITEEDDDNPGFQKLDWACDMADKYGLYLIFDMHGCPGGQSGDHSTGKSGRNYLYKETRYQDIMENLWVKIADRYKDRTCVAAYDIMNEPFNNADAAHNVQSNYIANVWDNGDVNQLRIDVYDRMFKAIREKDPYHVITVEGIWRAYFLPNPSTYEWTNVMYQLHSYDSDDETTTELVNSLEDRREWYGVAGLMGEFNPLVYNKNIVSQMNEKGISYTFWNYKTTGVNSDSNWGLYHKNYSLSDIYNICGTTAANKLASSWNGYFFWMKDFTDTEIEETYQAWWTEEYLSTENFTLNNTLKGYVQ